MKIEEEEGLLEGVGFMKGLKEMAEGSWWVQMRRVSWGEMQQEIK